MRTIVRALLLSVGAVVTTGAIYARETAEIKIAERRVLSGPEIDGRSAPSSRTHRLTLTLVYFTDGAWSRDAVMRAARAAARLLAQCEVRLRRIELVRVDAPARYRYLDTPVSRELARALRPRKPTVYFVTDTRHQPAFDAEAIGRGNSGTRPELADSVWLTRATRDAGIALAHELVHVLTDSGEHVDLPGNLMRDETTPANTRLTDAQCDRLRNVGAKNGLLRRE